MTLMTLRFLALLALIFPMLAQTDSIAVSAIRTVDLNPDQITFNLAFGVDSDVSLDQVLQATQSLGLLARDLVGISSQAVRSESQSDSARLSIHFHYCFFQIEGYQ